MNRNVLARGLLTFHSVRPTALCSRASSLCTPSALHLRNGRSAALDEDEACMNLAVAPCILRTHVQPHMQ